MKAIDKKILDILSPLFGEACWRAEVGAQKSLSLGFGRAVVRLRRGIEKSYGEWELGTYNAAWRAVKDGRILCGSRDPADRVSQLSSALSNLTIGPIAAIEQSSDFDISLRFGSGIAIDVMSATSGDDECFHIFAPNHIYVEFSVQGGWRVGRPDIPWDPAST